MTSVVRVALAQKNFLVGDINGNAEIVIAAAKQARDEQNADIVLFPELCITGYPPEDLLFRDSIVTRSKQALERIKQELTDIAVVVGYPSRVEGNLYNAAGVIFDGELIAEYHKQELPNYLVFDEKRYFQPGFEACVFDFKGTQIAVTVCEDVWHQGPMSLAKEAGAKLMLNLNASPFNTGKQAERLQLLKDRAEEGGMPIVYTNLVGGQDELVFDGRSIVVDATGKPVFVAKGYEESVSTVEFSINDAGECNIEPSSIAPDLELLDAVYQTLVLGVRDYVNKNGFKGAVLGLSGGIDSALTLAVAVDALGKERVEAVMMPFRYTSKMSLEDAEQEANTLGVHYSVKPIAAMYEAFMETLADDFAGTARDTTEENLQARCRGVMLMALSNKKRYIVLTTGNKSEMAVGYATLYGDMAGGFDVLKDVPKTMVFDLCTYRNTLGDGEVIPQRVIDRPPSAELAPDQKDEDSLPPYDVLDTILELYIEKDYSANAIIAEGFAEADVKRAIRLVDLNEYKRRQAAVGVRITQRGFGRDRRYPITCSWPAGE